MKIEDLPGGESVAVPGHLFSGRGGEHYVLRVVGDSLIGEMVRDGDFVVVLRREVAEPGEMVVAAVGDDITLKRYYPEGNMVRLQPANAAMPPIMVPAKDVRVQGIVVGLMRKF